MLSNSSFPRHWCSQATSAIRTASCHHSPVYFRSLNAINESSPRTLTDQWQSLAAIENRFPCMVHSSSDCFSTTTNVFRSTAHLLPPSLRLPSDCSLTDPVCSILYVSTTSGQHSIFIYTFACAVQLRRHPTNTPQHTSCIYWLRASVSASIADFCTFFNLNAPPCPIPLSNTKTPRLTARQELMVVCLRSTVTAREYVWSETLPSRGRL